MALTDFNHTKHATVDERGDVDIHYYKNTSEDVQIEQSVLDSNANIPPNDHNLLSLLKDLSSFAFEDKLNERKINVSQAVSSNPVFNGYTIENLQDLVKLLGTKAFAKSVGTDEIKVTVPRDIENIIPGETPKTLYDLIQKFGICSMNKVLHLTDVTLSDDAATNKNLVPKNEKKISTILSSLGPDSFRPRYLYSNKTVTTDRDKKRTKYVIEVPKNNANAFFTKPHIYLLTMSEYSICQMYDLFISTMSKGTYISVYSNIPNFYNNLNTVKTKFEDNKFLYELDINNLYDKPAMCIFNIRIL